MSQNTTWRFVLCLLLSLVVTSAYAQDNSSPEQLIRELQAQNANLQGRLARVESSRTRLREQISTLESAAMAAPTVVETATEAPADNSAQLTRSQAAYDRLKQQMAQLQSNNVQLEARIDRELASKARLQGQFAALQESAASFEAQAEDATADAMSLRLQRKNSVRQILDLQKQLAGASSASEEANMIMADTSAAMSESTIESSADLAKIQTERDLAVQRIKELRTQMASMQEDTAKIQSERDLGVQRIKELRTQMASMQEDSAKIQSERDIAVERISELRGNFAAEQVAAQAESSQELARALKLGDRARAQRTAALEKLKALQNAAPAEEAMSEESASEETTVTVEATAENLAIYRSLAARLSAGETLSSEEQSQFESLQSSQKLAAEAIGGTTYTVVEGDNLSSIAQEVYGDGSRYIEILEANDYLTGNPDLIFPGFELVIPSN